MHTYVQISIFLIYLNLGSTSLLRAAENGHTKVVKLLVEKGSAVNVKNVWGK